MIEPKTLHIEGDAIYLAACVLGAYMGFTTARRKPVMNFMEAAWEGSFSAIKTQAFISIALLAISMAQKGEYISLVDSSDFTWEEMKLLEGSSALILLASAAISCAISNLCRFS